MKTFTTRFALAASAAISLFAVSGVAHAGEVVSDQRSWPSEVHESYTGNTRSGFDAMASMDAVRTTGSSFVYQGGPKTGTRAY